MPPSRPRPPRTKKPDKPTSGQKRASKRGPQHTWRAACRKSPMTTGPQKKKKKRRQRGACAQSATAHSGHTDSFCRDVTHESCGALGPLSCAAPSSLVPCAGARCAARRTNPRPVIRRWRTVPSVTALTPVFRDRALSFFNFYIHHRRYIKLWTLARKDLRRLHRSATHGVSQNGGLFREKARASINRPTSLFLRKIYQDCNLLILLLQM